MKSVLGILCIVLLSVPGLAQIAARTPSFDVVSIRENKNGNAVRGDGVTANGYHVRGEPPLLLLVTAFVPSDGKASSFNPEQMVGVPNWMLQTTYDIDAKVDEQDISAWERPDIQRAMLQQMLTDRFKLVAHREYQEKAVYDMVIAKGGPKFKASETTDIEVIRRTHPAASTLPGGVVLVRGSKRGETMLFGATIADLGILFGKGMGRPIEDKTGLTGKYDVTLSLDLSPAPDGSRPDPVAVVMTALQEQLGLKLESRKGKVEVLVIDHVERPSEN